MIPAHIATAVQHHWWLFLLRGIAALSFGVLAFIYPTVSLAYIVVSVSLWMLLASIVQFLLARAQRAMGAAAGWSVLGGFLSLALAAAAVVYPRLTVTTVLALIAWFALVVGVVQLVVAFRVRSFARALTTA